MKTSSDLDKIYVEISDTGRGIPQDQIKKIFTPFFTTKELGSGLGLAFAHRIIKDHGGNISVSSSVKEGTSFVITLPTVKIESKVQA